MSHLKCESDVVWGRATELLERFHGEADVTGDQYPYAAWASVLWSLLPDWAPVGELPSLLRDPATRTRLASSVEEGEGDAFQSSVKGVGWDRIVIESGADGRWNGKSIEAVGADLGVDPIEACFRLLERRPRHGVHRSRDARGRCPHDPRGPDGHGGLRRRLDVAEGPLGNAAVHPRNYGTFPRVLGRYVREGVAHPRGGDQEDDLAAGRSVRARPRVVAWSRALSPTSCVFDPLTVADAATFDEPHAYPTGIDVVVVNGRIAWDGAPVDRAGRVLRHGV